MGKFGAKMGKFETKIGKFGAKMSKFDVKMGKFWDKIDKFGATMVKFRLKWAISVFFVTFRSVRSSTFRLLSVRSCQKVLRSVGL